MFIVHKKGLKLLTATIRRLLYGYGGFNITVTANVQRTANCAA